MSGFEDDFGEMVESKDEDLLQVLRYIDHMDSRYSNLM